MRSPAVVTTSTGNDLTIPKSTGFVSSAIIGEGTSITESDPTLAVVTLKSFKYANFFEISTELANDTPTNLLSFLARQAALSLGCTLRELRRVTSSFRRTTIRGSPPPAGVPKSGTTCTCR